MKIIFSNFIKLSAIFFILGFLFFGFTNSASAATRTWTGTTSAAWSDASNWGGTAPVTGDDLVFPGGASNLSNTNDLTENTIFNSITLSGSGYTLSGNPIILGQGLAGITDSASSGGNTIAFDIRIDNASPILRDIVVTNTAETLTISGRIAGVGGIAKEGTGTLVLSGGNTFGGILKINAGVVNARHSTALGSILAGTEVVGGAALELQGNINISYEALALRGYGVSSGGALRNISGDNSFGGLITLSSAGGTEIASDSGTLTIKGGTTGNFPLIFDGAGNLTFSTTPLAGSGTITKNGAGTVTYNFPNTNTGATTINAGTILYGVDNAIMTGAITVTGGTLDIATFSDMVGTVTLGTLDLASGTITGTTGVLSSGSFVVYQGTISAIIAGQAGTLAKSTTGTVVLTRPNLYTGATTVTAGILKIQDSTSLGLIDGITTVSAGATLQIDGTGLSIPEYITFSGTGHLYAGAILNTTGSNTLTGLLTLAAAGLIESDASTTLTIDSKGLSAVTFGLTIGGEGNTSFGSTASIYGTSATLTKKDSGTLTLQAFNNFTGATNITYGSVVLSGSGAMPLSTTMTINSGASLTLDNTSSTTVVDRLADSLALTMNGGNFNFIGSSSISTDETAGVLTAGVATLSGNNTITITPGSGGSTTMQFASLTRTAGASILFRGTNLGSDPGIGVSNLLFTTAPTLTGGTGAANSETIPIIQGAFGDDSVSGTGTDMVTYGRGNSNGLRLLNGAGFSGEYTTNFATANANIKLTTATAAVTSSINSLILSGTASITNPGSAQVITLASGNILNLVSSNTIAGANTTIAAGAVEINISAPVDVDISALITTTGGLTKSGAGTLTFSTAKTYTGLTSVNKGTLLAGVSNFIASGNITINNATLDIAGFSDTVGAVILQTGTITGTTGVLTGTSYSFREGTVSAIIAGAVTVTRVATNTATDSVVLLTRENTYTGATTITSGILKIGAAGNGTNTPLGTTGGGTTVANGGALDLNGYTLSTAEGITSLAGLGFGPGTTVANGNSNMGALMNSSGTAVSYSGTIALGAAARINADYGIMTISSTISGNNALTFGGFSNINFSGVRSGTSTLTKDGIGTLTLSSGSSSYTGATTISAGTVKIGAASVGGTNSPLGTTGAATTVALGARLDLNGFNLGIAEALTLNGVGYGLGDFASGALMNSSGSSVTYTGLITLGSSGVLVKVDSGNISLTAAGTISGATFGLVLGGTGTGSLSSIIGTTSGTVTKIGTGTWTLSGISTYTGATAINNGTLKLGANSAGPTNSVLGTTAAGTTVYSGGALDFNGFTLGIAEGVTINGRGVNDGGAFIGSSGTFSGAIAQATDSRITNASGTLTLSAAVTGAFSLYIGGAGNITTSAVFAASALSITKQGAGTLTVTGANLYTGYTRVDAGTFAYAGTTTLVATNLIMNGGTFNSGANADAIGTVTLVGGTIANSAALTGTAYTLESGTISGILAGAIAVTKNTNNTVTLTGVNTISSTTTINAGTLAISGSGSATATTITVNLGGTLTLDNSTTAVASRLGDALALTMNGGSFNFIGNTAAASSETTGALTLSTGHNVVTVTPGTGGSTTMTFASLSRTAGATVLFRGTNLGTAAAANVSTLVFTATPTLTGAGGASGSTTVSVIKGAFGDTSLSGSGSDMVTYQGGTGLRLLNGAGFSGEYSATLTTNTNVKLTGNVAASTVSINSLILNGFGVTNAAATITMASASLAGNILMNSATDIAGSSTTIGITTFELDILTTSTSTISAVIGTATTGSLTLSGPGNVTLSAANLYTSTTFINNATLTYGASNVLSSGGVTMRSGTYNLNGNSDTIGALSLTASIVSTGAGTLTGNGSFTTITNNNFSSIISGNLGLGANATFTIGDGLMDNDAVISAVISGAFTFAKAGTGVLELSGSNSYSGATTISAGTLRLGATGGGTNTPLGTTAAGTTVTGASSALDLNGYTLGTTEALTLTGALATGALQNTSSAAVNYSGLITLGAASTIIANYGDINITNTGNITGATFGLTIGGAGNGTLASNLNTTSGTLTKNGLGLWTVSGGSSTFTGLTTISAGTFKLGSAGSGSNTPLGTSAGGVSITSGAIFDLNGFTLATAEALAINGTGIANIGAFINSSNNSISYSGVITPGATSRLANYGTGLFTLSGNIVGSTRTITFVTVGDITQSSASVWSGTSTSLIKEGSGTLILAGQNSFTTGTVTVSTGVLRLGASGGATNTPLGTSGAGTTVALGAVLDLSTFNLGGASTYETLGISGTGIKLGGALISSAASGTTNFGAVTVTANSIVTNSAAGTIRFNSTVTAAAGINLWINGSGPTIIGGAYGAASSATLTKDGSGTLTISAVATNTGLVRINGGTLAYGIADALSTSPVTVAGGTWDLAGYSEGGTTLIGAVTLIDGSIVNTGGAATITSSAAYTTEKGTISAVLAGAAIAFNKNTGGTVTLSAANTFAGLTSVNSGTLLAGVNNFIAAGNITITGGTLDMSTFTDTVGTVTLTSGAITGSTGVLTGTAYTFSNSGTVSAILAGSIGLTKTGTGTVSLLGSNTYTGTTTITAGVLRANSTTALGDGSGTNTLIFNGGTLRAGGNISSPSGRAVTLTSTGLIDTNNYTVTLAGTIGSASGITKNGMGTLSTTGAVTLGAALTVNNGTFDQASSLSGPTSVTVASSGVWSNVGTGAVTLAGNVTNSGVITLNSNNGSQCVNGADSILVRSSVNNTLRTWASGATQTGIFNLFNLDVDDMTTSSITVYTSTLSGDTTWTVGSCGISVSGTANGNNTATVKVAINGSISGSTGTIGGGTWTISSVAATTNDIITVFVDNVTDANESTAVTKYGGSGNITGMVLNTNVLTIGSNQNNSVSTTNLAQYESTDDEDVMHTSTSGALSVQGTGNTYTGESLSVLASNTLTVASGSTESITTETLTNAGTITATGTPTIFLAGTTGTLFTNTGTFTAASSTVNLTGNGSATIASGTPTFYNLTSSGTGTKTLGEALTVSNILRIAGGTIDTDTTNDYTINAGQINFTDNSVLGYNTIGGSNTNFSVEYAGTVFTPSSNGSISKIWTYIQYPWGSVSPLDLRAAVYSVNGNLPDTLLASGSRTSAYDDTAGWVSVDVSYNVTQNVPVYLVVWGAGAYTQWHDSGTTDQSFEKWNETYPTWETPETGTDYNTHARKYSIYAEVISSGGTFKLNDSTVNLTGTGTVFDAADGTIDVSTGTSTIKLTDTSATAKTFAGAGKTYDNLWFAPGAGTGAFTVSGSNTFLDFKDDGTGVHAINFTAGTTTTISTLTLDQTAGLLTLQSTTPSSQWNLVDTSGTNTVRYVSITDSCASGGATWDASTYTADNTNGGNNCGWVFVSGISISGSANGNNTATVKVAINGSVSGSSGTIGSGTWTISNVVASINDIVTVWVDAVADNLESTAVTKYSGSGNIAGMVLNTNVLTIGSDQNNSVSTTNLTQYEAGDDEDVMHTSTSGALSVQGTGNTYTGESLSVLASNTLTVDSSSTESITTETLTNAGTITATGTPTITLAGTTGTLFTNTGTFTAASSTVEMTGNGDATIISGTPTFYNLTSSGTGTKTLGGALTVTNVLNVSAGTLAAGSYGIILSGSTGTPFTVAGTFDPGTGTVTYTGNNGGGNTTVANVPYYNLTVNNGAETFVLAGNTVGSAAGILTIADGTLSTTGSNHSLSIGKITMSAPSSAILVGNASTINLTATSGTLMTLVGGASFTYGTSTIDLSGNGDATFNSGTFDVYNLTVSGTGVKTLGLNTVMQNNATLSVTAGTFDPSTYQLNGAGSNTLSVGASGTIRIGSSTFADSYSAGFTTRNLSSGSTVEYSLSGTQTVDNTLSYSNLKITAAGTKSLAGTTTATGTLTVSAGTLDTTSGNNYTVNADKIVISGGTFTPQASTVNITGTSGTLFTKSSGTFTAGTSTVNLTGNGSATVASGTPTFYNLTSSGTGTKSLGEALTVTGTLTVSGGTLDTTGSNYTVNADKVFVSNASSSVFGYNTVGGSQTGSYFAGDLMASRFTPTASGTITDVNVYIQSTGTAVFKTMLYADNGGAPGALLTTSSGTGSMNTSAAWRSVSMPYNVSKGVNYWIGVTGDDNIIVNYDAGSTNQTFTDDNNNANYPNISDPGNADAYFAAVLSIYANVTNSTGTLLANASTINVTGTSGTLFTKESNATFTAGTSTVNMTGNIGAAASPSYRSHLNYYPGSPNSFTFSGEPTGTAQGDIMIAAYFLEEWANGAPPVITPPTGWSDTFNGNVLKVDVNGGPTFNRKFTTQLFWIRRGASAPALNFSATGTSNWSQALLTTIKDVKTTGDPFTIATSVTKGTDNVDSLYSDISGTTSEANELLFWLGSQWMAQSSSTAPTTPAFTTRLQADDLTTGDYLKVSAGSTGTITGGSWSGTGNGNDATFLVSLKSEPALTVASGTPTFYNLTSSGTGTKSLGETLTVSNLLTVSNGTLDTSSNTVNADKVVISGGTFTPQASTVNITGTSGTLFTKSSGTFTAGTSTVNLTGNGSATVASGTPSFYNLTSSGTGTKSLGEALTATGTLTVSAGTFSTSGSNYTVNAGTLAIGTGGSAAAYVNSASNAHAVWESDTEVDAPAINVTTGNHLTVFVRSQYTSPTVTDTASNTFTLKDSFYSTSGMFYIHTFECNNCTGNASDVIRATPSQSDNRLGIWVIQHSGIAGTTNFAVPGSGSSYANTSTATGSFNVSTVPVVALAMVADLGNGQTWTAPSGFTNRETDSNGGGMLSSRVYDTTQTGITVTATATTSWLDRSIVVATFTPVVNSGTFVANASTINLTGTGTVFDKTAGTFTAGTSTMKLTDQSATSKTINGGGTTFGTLWVNGSGSSDYTINGSNSINTLKVDTSPNTIKFAAGTTTTVTNWDIQGNGSNSLVTLKSTVDSSTWTLSKISGEIVSRYLSLRDSIATGGATFMALASTNVSGNSGWIFLDYGTGGGGSVESTANVGTCADGIQNGDETGTDTGGRCSGGGGQGGGDGTCNDGIQNGDETGTDTGGRCSLGTCADGIQNGDETGTDTGGRCSGGGGQGGGDGGDLGYLKNRNLLIASAGNLNILSFIKYLLSYI